MTIPRPCISSRARSRRCARSSPMSPPPMRWRGCPTTCICCRRKVDQLAHSPGHGDALAMLEQRIAALTSTIESREQQRPAESSGHYEFLESAIRALTERIDRMPVGNDNASAFAHLEQRVSYLLERIEAATDPRGSATISAGSRTRCRISSAISKPSTPTSPRSPTTAGSPLAPPPQIGYRLVDIVKRELSDIRFSQVETDRRTQDALETVHSHARPCRRSPCHDRRRSAQRPRSLQRRRRCRWLRAGDADAAACPPAPVYVEPVYVDRSSRRRGWRCRSRSRNCPIRPRQTQFSAPAEEHFVAAPRDFHAAARRASAVDCRRRCRQRRARSAKSSAARQFARRDRVRSAAGSSARAWHRPESADVLTVGAHRSLRGSARRDRRTAQRADEHVELHRRRAPRRPSGRRRARRTTRRSARRLPPRPSPRKAKESRRTSPRTSRAPPAPKARASPRKSARCWSARASW